MVFTCVAASCKNHYRQKTHSFYGFPFIRPEILHAWIEVVRRVNENPNFTPTKRTKLCADHFLPSDYQERLGSVYKFNVLRRDAVPSVFKSKAPEAPMSARKKRRLKALENKIRRQTMGQGVATQLHIGGKLLYLLYNNTLVPLAGAPDNNDHTYNASNTSSEANPLSQIPDESSRTSASSVQITKRCVSPKSTFREVPLKPENTTDEFELFGQTVAAYLRTFSLDDALESRVDIMKYLVEKRLKYSSSYSSSVDSLSSSDYGLVSSSHVKNETQQYDSPELVTEIPQEEIKIEYENLDKWDNS